jgi:hypothetical protein
MIHECNVSTSADVVNQVKGDMPRFIQRAVPHQYHSLIRILWRVARADAEPSRGSGCPSATDGGWRLGMDRLLHQLLGCLLLLLLLEQHQLLRRCRLQLLQWRCLLL